MDLAIFMQARISREFVHIIFLGDFVVVKVNNLSFTSNSPFSKSLVSLTFPSIFHCTCFLFSQKISKITIKAKIYGMNKRFRILSNIAEGRITLTNA